MPSGVPAGKKLHWTQTAEGKKRLSLLSKRMHKLKRKEATQHGNARNGKEAPATGSTIPETTLAYALGHVEAWLDTYASSSGVSARTLAFRVGTVLLRKARG